MCIQSARLFNYGSNGVLIEGSMPPREANNLGDVIQGWQVSANSGLNRPGRNRFLPNMVQQLQQ